MSTTHMIRLNLLTQPCTECGREYPKAFFLDKRHIYRRRCGNCRKYHADYDRAQYAGADNRQAYKAKREQSLTRPVPEGHKICGRCLNIKADENFINSMGRVSPQCHECREYAATWRRNDLRASSAAKLAPRRAKARAASKRIRDACLEAYGGKCACCGESRPEFLAIDHINGGGGKHRKEIGYGTAYFSWLKKQGYPSGYRVLCHNCNMAIAFYGGVCPHQKDALHPIDRILTQQPLTGTVN
jgi:hypothetical protein